MEAHVLIPQSADDIDILIWRLQQFHNIIVRLEDNKIILKSIRKGDQECLVAAHNYALRFIGPESIQYLHVSPECLQLFHVNGLIRHFEETFDIILCLKANQLVIAKGRKQDTERFQSVLKRFDLQCTCQQPRPFTLFKLSNLRTLCDKFNVSFDEIPCKPALQTALLTYFLSLLDRGMERCTREASSVPYIEVYRNQDTELIVNNSPGSTKNSRISHASRFGGISNNSKAASGNRNASLPEAGPSSGTCIAAGAQPFHIKNKVTRAKDGVSLPTPRVRSAARSQTPVTRSNGNKNKVSNKPGVDKVDKKLRTVVIDGSNVAFAHGNQKEFSPQGIQLAVDFFLRRGHTNVVAIVPRHRQGRGGSLFDKLEQSGHLCYSPSRFVGESRQVADDDRIILQLAVERDAVVVSNDQYRNYRDTNVHFKQVIDHRLLQYTLALDTFIVAEDPHGPNKPSLTQLLNGTSN